MTYSRVFSLVGGLTALLTTVVLQAGPIDASRDPQPEKIQVVQEAEHRVDHAWEIYHRAALGGTIASPALQAQIEQHLHDARTLMTQAQEAADREDTGKVKRLVGEIKIHTAQAIQGSKEQKR